MAIYFFNYVFFSHNNSLKFDTIFRYLSNYQNVSKIMMLFQKKFNDGLRSLTNTVNLKYTNQINFDLTQYTDLQDSIEKNTGVNQFNLTKNDLALQITGWSCRSSKELNIEQAFVHSLNGLSIIGENQVDYSMLMLSFDQVVSLTSLELGWIEGDNNVSLLALNSSEINCVTDNQWPELLTSGWSPAGEYFNLDCKGNGNRVNLSRIISKHWLIGSYNPNLYNFYSNNTDQIYKYDKFKLQSVTVSVENIMIKARKFAENRLF